jgi:hypothetical protein
MDRCCPRDYGEDCPEGFGDYSDAAMEASFRELATQIQSDHGLETETDEHDEVELHGYPFTDPLQNHASQQTFDHFAGTDTNSGGISSCIVPADTLSFDHTPTVSHLTTAPHAPSVPTITITSEATNDAAPEGTVDSVSRGEQRSVSSRRKKSPQPQSRVLTREKIGDSRIRGKRVASQAVPVPEIARGVPRPRGAPSYSIRENYIIDVESPPSPVDTQMGDAGDLQGSDEQPVGRFDFLQMHLSKPPDAFDHLPVRLIPRR